MMYNRWLHESGDSRFDTCHCGSDLATLGGGAQRCQMAEDIAGLVIRLAACVGV